MKTVYDIIKRPVISEKATDQFSEKRYTFVVDKRANKLEIKNAVEKIFDVKVIAVTTQIVKGKPKRQGKYEGYTSTWKKAIVKLSADSKELEFFEGM